METHVKISSGPPSSALLRVNLTPTAPLFPMKNGPHPVHDVCTLLTRLATTSSRPYTSRATPTLTTLAMSEYDSLLGACASIWERMRALRSLMTAFENPDTA